LIIRRRSSTVNSGLFSTFLRTATMMESKSALPRWMMSTWPRVRGSKDPG
jgi:hypothetical protein